MVNLDFVLGLVAGFTLSNFVMLWFVSAKMQQLATALRLLQAEHEQDVQGIYRG